MDACVIFPGPVADFSPQSLRLFQDHQRAMAFIPAQKGDTTLFVRSTAGMNVGDTIQIGTGSDVETCKIASVGTAAGTSTTLWQPLPDGPVITIPPGSTSVPYTGGGRGGGGARGARGG